ncbi:hypothetical protein [Bacillus kexueae]|uniref:hypothetical protein n=1 Tax=Aeribacillus kexueae TaxID=2078952 RepID=UPI001FB02E2D|nr:hypothetical protein [Bacillus kexueae]
MTEVNRIKEIRLLSEEVMQMIVQDHYETHPLLLKRAIELLSQVVFDFSILESDEMCDKEELLKGTLAKMKIAHNAVYTGIGDKDEAIS